MPKPLNSRIGNTYPRPNYAQTVSCSGRECFLKRTGSPCKRCTTK